MSYNQPPSGYGPPPGGGGYGAPPGGGGYGAPPGGGYGPPPGGGYAAYGAPPNLAQPPPKKKGSMGLILGIVGGVVGLAVVGGIIIGVVMGRTQHKRLPIDAHQLPSQTTEVGQQLIEATRETDPRIRRPFLSAEMGALFCRPELGNPAKELDQLGKRGSFTAKRFFTTKNLENVSDLLVCGETLGQNLSNDFVSSIRFAEDEKNTRSVTMAQIKVAEMPSKLGFVRQSFSGLQGFCQIPKPTDPSQKQETDCKNEFEVALHQDPVWFVGRKESIDAFAKGLAKPREEVSTQVQALQDAMDATEALEFREIETDVKSSKTFFMLPCFVGSGQTAGSASDFLKSCFPDTLTKQMEEVDAKIKGAAFEMDGDLVKAKRVHGNTVFVARDADEAKSLESAINDIVRDWKSHLENNEAKMIKQGADNPQNRREREWQSTVDTFVKALRGMTVDRKGRTVAIRFDQALSSDDVSELKDAEQKTTEDRANVGAILDAIQTKHQIPQANLAKIVGDKWAAFLLAGRSQLSVDDCNKIKANADKLSFASVKSEEGRTALIQTKILNCSEKPEMPDARKQCLLNVKDGPGFEKCPNLVEPPESEFGKK